MKDSPKEKVGKISFLYLAINEGLPEGEGWEYIAPLPGHKWRTPRKIPSLYLAIIEGLPKKKVWKISSLYLAINEGLPEGEGGDNVHPISQSQLHKALPSFQDELYDTVIAEIMNAYK
jgi:hypothetical protein